MKHKKYVYILTIALSIILLATSIVNLIAAAPNSPIMSQNVVVDITTAIVMIIALLCINFAVFLSCYKLDNDKLTIALFFIIPINNISYEDIYLLRTNPEKTVLVLYSKKDSENEDNIISINIDSKSFMDFIDNIKNKNSKVLFEIYQDKE